MISDSPTEYMASEGFVICPETCKCSTVCFSPSVTMHIPIYSYICEFFFAVYDTFGAVLFDMNFDVKMDEL